jgi:hypothetical protein
MSTDISEEHVASIFRVEVKAEQETSVIQVATRAAAPKRRLTFKGLHGVISRKIIFLITIAVRT